ncbi:MAG: fibronectin type III domain-containing protein, partial [Chloroflexi bacterium]|nr:fibronectin type III domain-containing protein [Chloroflexota bacterium]
MRSHFVRKPSFEFRQRSAAPRAGRLGTWTLLAGLGLIVALAVIALAPPATVQGQGTPTAPDAPQNLVVNPQAGALHVSWEAPADNGGADISGHSVRYRQAGATTWTDLSVDDGQDGTTTTISASALSVTIPGLTAGQAYEVEVAAINSAGTGVYTDTATGTPLSAPPGKPTSLSVTAGGVGAVTVSWVAPADTGSSAISGYSVQYRQTGATDWTDLSVDDGQGGTTTTIGASPVTISGLTAGQAYEVQVAAINSEATGAYADPATGTPTTAPPPPSPAGPALASAVAEGASLTLTFSAPLDANSVPASTAFTVEVDPDGDATTESAAAVSLAQSNAVAISGSTVTLTLAAALTGGETVTVAYAKPAANPLRDSSPANSEVDSFAAVTAHNVSGVPPRALSAITTAGGTKITISFSQALDTTSTPAGSAFTVTAAGSTLALDASEPVVVSGSTVTLQLGESAGQPL